MATTQLFYNFTLPLRIEEIYCHYNWEGTTEFLYCLWLLAFLLALNATSGSDYAIDSLCSRSRNLCNVFQSIFVTFAAFFSTAKHQRQRERIFSQGFVVFRSLICYNPAKSVIGFVTS